MVIPASIRGRCGTYIWPETGCSPPLLRQNALLIFFSTSAAGSSTAMLFPWRKTILLAVQTRYQGVCMHTGAGSPRRQLLTGPACGSYADQCRLRQVDMQVGDVDPAWVVTSRDHGFFSAWLTSIHAPLARERGVSGICRIFSIYSGEL